MKNFISIFSIAILGLLLSGFTASPSTSTYNNWKKIGSKKVDYKIDRDVIHVGARDGLFSKLNIRVTGGDLNMHKMIVEYRNGQKEVIELRNRFRQNSPSRIIDLKGKKRIIKDITFWYDTKNCSGKRAIVNVFGKR